MLLYSNIVCFVLIIVFWFLFFNSSLLVSHFKMVVFKKKCKEKMHVLSLNMFFMVVHNILIFQLKCLILMPLIPWPSLNPPKWPQDLAWTLQSDPRVHLKVDPWPTRVASSSALIWTPLSTIQTIILLSNWANYGFFRYLIIWKTLHFKVLTQIWLSKVKAPALPKERWRKGFAFFFTPTSWCSQ